MEIAIVTGATQGIGFEIANVLAKEGNLVCLVDVNKSVIERATRLKNEGYFSAGFVCDVSSRTQVKNCVNEIINEYEKIDKLVNAAGISISVPFTDEEIDELSYKVMAVNFWGTWNFCRNVVPHMKNASSGSIVNFASITGPVVSDPGMCAYAASKGAVYGFTKSLAVELASMNINVNAVLPGYVWTDMLAKYNPKNPQQVKDRFSKGIPIGRLAEANEIAQIVSFLLSDKAQYITGQGIIIDGGSTLVETKEIVKKGRKDQPY